MYYIFQEVDTEKFNRCKTHVACIEKYQTRRNIMRELINVPLLYISKYNKIFLNFVTLNPVSASIKITENCNSRCITCNMWKNRYSDELTTTELEDILHQLKNIHIKSIFFTGGEALIRKDIGELISMGKKQDFIVSLQTNGILLNKKAETIIDSGLDSIIISIDGIGKTSDKIRGIPGQYDETIKGIYALKNYLAKKKDRKLEIIVATTLTSSNISEIPRLIELCKELKVKWSFNLLDTNPYFFKDVDISELMITDKDSVDRTIDYLYKVRKEFPEVFDVDPLSLEFARKFLKNEKPYFHCVLGYFFIFIGSYGDVYSGCWVFGPMGNLRKKKLTEILKSDEYNDRCLKMFNLKCPRCTCGYDLSYKINNLPLSAKRMFKKYWSLIK